jgi:hypothetical protein
MINAVCWKRPVGRRFSFVAIVCLLGFPAGPLLAGEYRSSMAQVGVTKSLHQDVSDGSGVIVGILDTLVDYRQHEFTSRIETSRYAYGDYDFFGDHGTHVAGIIGAAANGTGMVGVAPKAEMVNFGIFDDNGWAPTYHGQDAIAWVVGHGASVVNMSYGSTTAGQVFVSLGEIGTLASYNDDVVFVHAAMNGGMNVKSQPLPSGVGIGDLDHILIVGSVNGNNSISSFSNRPGQACWGTTGTSCSSSAKMMNWFIMAPGKEKYSTLPNQRYGIMSGTSMATPMVTGAVALLQSKWPHLKDDPAGTVNILKQSAKDLGAKGVDPVYGWGLLDVARAFEPIGAAYVASGAAVAGGGTKLAGSSLALSAAVPAGASVEAAVGDLVVFDDFGRDFKAAPAFVEESDDGELMADKLTALGGALDRRHGAFAMASLSASFSAAGSPEAGGYSEFAIAQEGYGLTLGFGQALGGTAGLAMASDDSPQALLQYGLGLGLGPAGEDLDQGFYAGGSLDLLPGLSLAAFYNENGHQPATADADPVAQLREEEADASRLMAVQLSYEPLPGVTLGASFTQLEEEAGLLGSDGAGAFALGEDGETQMAGLSLALDLGSDARLFGFYQEAWSSGEAASGSLFGAVDDWRSRRYGVALGVADSFEGGDWLEFSLVRPLAVYSGSGAAEVPVGRTDDGEVVYESTNYDLASDALPLELTATYLGAGGEWAPGRDYNYGLQLNWRDDDAAGGIADSTVGVLFAVKASF